MIKGENSRKDLERSLPTVYICSRYRPKSADPERQKIELKGGAGDQGIMYGYATNETAEQMPIPYMVATKFLQLLKNHPTKMFRADAKARHWCGSAGGCVGRVLRHGA